MPLSKLEPSTGPLVRFIALSLSLTISGCFGAAGEGSESSEQVGTQRSAVVLPPDSLSDYATKCDLATGVHVPSFNCDAGTEVPQGFVVTGLNYNTIALASNPAISSCLRTRQSRRAK